MNDLQRFLAVCHGEKPDYVPLFGIMGAQGIANYPLNDVYKNLVNTGMPDIMGFYAPEKINGEPIGWHKYWGVDNPIYSNIFAAHKWGRGIKSTTTIKNGFEYIEYETGALTRQVLGNDDIYIMPEYISHHVRDRESWEKYKELCSPSDPWSTEEIIAACEPYKNRTQPLCAWTTGTWGHIRTELMGNVESCTVFYDDPELCENMFEWLRWQNRTFILPVIEHLKPEIVLINEDNCYRNGLLISPEHFNQYCAPQYHEIGEVVKRNDIPMFIIDCDGFAEPLLPLIVPHGVNGLYPWEVKPGNDLYRVREKYPDFVFFGALEKECLNAGNGGMIRPIIEAKVDLLRGGRYFPNIDHTMQPMATFENLCKFMTLLHEVTENPKGEFPRIRA